jgi:hypothetical protein
MSNDKLFKGKAVLAYTAGIIDGEGSIYINNQKWKERLCLALRVSVVNTNEWLIQWFKMQYGGHISSKYHGHERFKVAWVWELSGGKASDFLKLIIPYLQIKKPQAEIAIRFQKSKGPMGQHVLPEKYALQEAEKVLLSKLNKRGVHREE